MYFYELHESDDDLFSDVLLAHETEFDEQEFLELVLEARQNVLPTFEEDTLVEAIANDLEHRHGFVHIDDRRLRAAVNVSAREGETFIAELEPGEDDRDREDDEEYRSLLIEVDRNDRPYH